MKILLATFGTRGDVEPFAHLARAAQQRGHTVVVLATEEFRDYFHSGEGFETLPGSVRDLIAQTNAQPLAAATIFSTVIKPLMREGMAKLHTVAKREAPDVIVFHPKIVAAPLVAATVGARAVQVEFAPITVPTAKFASAGVGVFSLGPLNRLTYSLVNSGSQQLFAKDLKKLGSDWRADPAIVSTVVAASPTLVARPTDYPQNALIAGQWTNQLVRAKLDKQVRDFCSLPTIAVTFGSMVPPRGAVSTVIEAARSLGLRVIVVGGWSGLDAELVRGDNVMLVDSVPHDTVFPLCELVIHHGGAGTTHAAARAGVPQWIIPVLADQPWWKSLTQRLGIGLSSASSSRLTVGDAMKAISRRASLSARAQEIAQKLSVEDGCSVTLDFLEREIA